MFLSRIIIDPNNRRTLQALDNPEILHGMVEACFPGEQKRKLWRLDKLNGKLCLLLLSYEKADLSQLVTQIGFPGAEWETRDYQPLIDRIKTGSIWQFRLTANPVTSVPQQDRRRGKITAITIAAHQREWLIRQGERHGFLLAPGQFDVVRSEWQIFRNKGRTVSILYASFEGLLTVIDEDSLKKALLKGIGRGKAYGMGLLTVMKYR